MLRLLRGIIIAALIAGLLFFTYASADTLSNVSVNSAPLVTQSSSMDGMVRVYLSSLGSPSSLSLTISGSYSLSDGTNLSNGETLTVSFNSSNGSLTLKRNGTSYSMGKSFTLRRHSTTGSNGIKIAQARKSGNLYPGDLQFKAVSSGGSYKLYTIAHIYIENYLYGVLPYEMGSSAPMEALKAQAVAARTYTVRMMNARKSSLYDVVDTTGDQTYNGTPTSATNCNTAVDRTKGIILKNGSSFTATYYSSSNGGQTESIKNAWGSSGYSYLDVHDDPFDYANPSSVVRQATVYKNASSSYNNASLMTLLQKKAVSLLSAAGYKATSANTTVLTVDNITPTSPKYSSPSKLYTKMDFTLTVSTYNASNTKVSISTTVTCDIFNELESMLTMSIQSGSNELWSVVKNSSSFALQARRYGHGIGMSQRGAMYMGQLGFSYDEILGFYYVGSKRVGCTFTNTILSANSSEVITTDEDPVSTDDDSGIRGIVALGNGSQLAIRNAQSTTADILTVIDNATPVTVLVNLGSYCKIKYGSIVGYVPTSALTIVGTAPSSDDTSVSSIAGYAVVTSSSYLNLRQSGSYSAKILSTARGGAILTVLEQGSEWAKIQYGKLTAYAATDFLDFSKDYPETISQTDPGSGTDDALSAIVATKVGSLNMRQQAKAGSTVLTTIPQGATVAVTDRGSTWSAVRYYEYSGFVMTEFLSFDGASAPQDDAQTQDQYAKVTTKSGSLNLRQQPKAGSAIYKTIPQFAIITVHSMNSSWSHVTYDSTTGYVMTAFLTVVDASEAENQPDPEEQPEDPAAGDSDEPGTDGPTAVVSTASGSLNLRFDALPGSRVLIRIPQGTTIPVLQKMNTWTYTKYQDQFGYVMNTYLTFSGSGDTTGNAGDAIPATVNTVSGSLNLRKEPYGRVLVTIPQNAAVSVYQKGTSWSYLAYNNVNGYVMTQYLSFDPTGTPSTGDQTADDNDTPAAGDSATVVLETGSLNLRASKSDTAEVLTTIPGNTVVTLMSYDSDWCKVSHGAYQGYVQSKFLNFDAQAEPTPSPTATQPPSVLTAWVNTPEGSLNMRNVPSGRVTTAIPQYAEVTVLSGFTETWCKTQYGSYIGYTMTKYLTTTKPKQDPYAVKAWVKTPNDGSLNLRTVPSGKVITVMPQHAQVTVLTDISDTWCQTQYGDQTGYTMSQYLTTEEPGTTATPSATPAPTTQAEQLFAWVKTPDDGSLNLRTKPNGSVLLTIPQNAQVTVLTDISDTWCKTQYGSTVGYTVSKYLTAKEPELTPAPEKPDTTDATGTTAWVSTPDDGSLNLRSKPNGNVLLTIPQYAQVAVLTDLSNTWCKTQYNSITGYAVSKYLTTKKPSEEPKADTPAGTQTGVTAWVITPEGSLNLRSEPNGDVLTTIPQYAQVSVLSGLKDTWAKTKYNNIVGYTVSKYLSTSKPSQTTASTPAPTAAPSTGEKKTLDPTLQTVSKKTVVYIRPAAGQATLKLYDECKESAKVLESMPESSEVEVLQAGSVWCEVRYENQQGYCLRDGLSFFED